MNSRKCSEHKNVKISQILTKWKKLGKSIWGTIKIKTLKINKTSFNFETNFRIAKKKESYNSRDFDVMRHRTPELKCQKKYKLQGKINN